MIIVVSINCKIINSNEPCKGTRCVGSHITNENNRFISQREFAGMALLKVEITNEGLKVFHQNDTTDFIIIPFFPLKKERVTADIWGIACEPLLVSDEADKWFSKALNTNCRIVYMDDETKVIVNDKYNINNSLTSFSDGFPILMISEASLNDLNSKATETLPMNRFRPNLVINGANAFEEDGMKEFMINGITFYGAKPSARCVITTINQSTLLKGKEPLKTLATYRSLNNKIYFGENVIAGSIGKINVGDTLSIIKTKETLFQKLS